MEAGKNLNAYTPPDNWVEARESALSEVREERRKQFQKWGLQKWDEGTGLAILVEEVSEVAKAICEKKPEEVRAELIQVSAVAAAFVQMIDNGSA